AGRQRARIHCRSAPQDRLLQDVAVVVAGQLAGLDAGLDLDCGSRLRHGLSPSEWVGRASSQDGDVCKARTVARALPQQTPRMRDPYSRASALLARSALALERGRARLSRELVERAFAAVRAAGGARDPNLAPVLLQRGALHEAANAPHLAAR